MRLVGEGVGGGHELVGRLVGLAGRGGHVPAVDEPVEHDEAGEGLAGHLAEGSGDGLVEGARRGDRGHEVGEHGPKSPSGSLRSGSSGASPR